MNPEIIIGDIFEDKRNPPSMARKRYRLDGWRADGRSMMFSMSDGVYVSLPSSMENYVKIADKPAPTFEVTKPKKITMEKKLKTIQVVPLKKYGSIFLIQNTIVAYMNVQERAVHLAGSEKSCEIHKWGIDMGLLRPDFPRLHGSWTNQGGILVKAGYLKETPTGYISLDKNRAFIGLPDDITSLSLIRELDKNNSIFSKEERLLFEEQVSLRKKSVRFSSYDAMVKDALNMQPSVLGYTKEDYGTSGGVTQFLHAFDKALLSNYHRGDGYIHTADANYADGCWDCTSSTYRVEPTGVSGEFIISAPKLPHLNGTKFKGEWDAISLSLLTLNLKCRKVLEKYVPKIREANRQRLEKESQENPVKIKL